MGRSGFFRKCSKKWLFPSMQDAIRHAQYEPVLVSYKPVLMSYVPVLVSYMPVCPGKYKPLLVNMNLAW
jgi:hypothetical protein